MIVLLAIWSLRKLVLIMTLVFNQFVYLIQVWAYSSDARRYHCYRCCSHIHICALVAIFLVKFGATYLATIVASLGGVQVGLLSLLLLWTVEVYFMHLINLMNCSFEWCRLHSY